MCSWWYLITVSLYELDSRINFFPEIYPLDILYTSCFYLFPITSEINPDNPLLLGPHILLWLGQMLIKYNDVVIRQGDTTVKLISRSFLETIWDTDPVDIFSLKIIYVRYNTSSSQVDGAPNTTRVSNTLTREDIWCLILFIPFSLWYFIVVICCLVALAIKQCFSTFIYLKSIYLIALCPTFR